MPLHCKNRRNELRYCWASCSKIWIASEGDNLLPTVWEHEGAAGAPSLVAVGSTACVLWRTDTPSSPRKGLSFSRQTAVLGCVSWFHHQIDFLFSIHAKSSLLFSHNLISFWLLIFPCLYLTLCPVADECCSSWDLAEHLLLPGKCSPPPWCIYFLISPGHSVAL